jgi:hypothetical protein
MDQGAEITIGIVSLKIIVVIILFRLLRRPYQIIYIGHEREGRTKERERTLRLKEREISRTILCSFHEPAHY